MSKPIFREETDIEQVRITCPGSSGYAAFRMVFDPDRGETSAAVLGIHEHPPKIQPIAPHFHREVEETVYIVSGEGVVTLGSDPNTMEEHSFKAGSCWYVPPGCYHQIVNTGETVVKIVVSYFRNDIVNTGETAENQSQTRLGSAHRSGHKTALAMTHQRLK